MSIRYRRIYLFVAWLLAAWFPAPASAELDAVQAGLLAGETLPMRWDNVEGAPWHVAGEAPAYAMDAGMHLVRLEPGDSVTVRLPVYEMLRIYRPDGTLSRQDVQVSLSNGTGLYAMWQAQRSTDGKSLLIAPHAPHALLARLQVPSTGKTERLALFVSRHESTGRVAPYRGTVSLGTERVGIRRADQRGSRTFWILQAAQPVRVHVRGPARFVLENRFRYGERESSLGQRYQVEVRMDGEPLRLLEFESSIDSTQPVYVGSTFLPGGERRPVGQLQKGYLEVPEGEHELVLTSNVNLYARLLEQEHPDYLFPALNAPDPDAKHVRDHMAGNARASWQWTPDDIRQQAADARPMDIETIARRIVQDNHFRDGGLVGAMLMQRYAARHPEFPQARRQAELMFARHTFYRDLFPSPVPQSLQREFFWFVPRHLNDPGASTAAQAIEPGHLRESLFAIAGAYFMTIPQQSTSAGHALQFFVPERAAPSVLRVSTGSAGRGREQVFWLQFDDRPPIRMRVAGRVPEMDIDAFAPARAEAALQQLAQQFGEQDATTLGGAYGSYRMPARLAEVASMELPLPAQVRRIRIWQDEGSHVSVALQYRAASRDKMSETAYLSALQRIGRDHAFRMFVAHVHQILREGTAGDYGSPPPVDGSFDLQQQARLDLLNEWQPLLRLMLTKNRAFQIPEGASRQALLPTRRIPAARLQRLTETAQAAEHSQAWLEALEAWSTVAAGSGDATYRQAQMHRIDALQHLGEVVLAGKMLQALFLYADDPEMRRLAFGRLLDDARRTGRVRSMLPLLVAAVIRDGSAENYGALASLLGSMGETRMALTLGLLVPEAHRDWSALAAAAYRLGWPQTLAMAESHLSPEERHLWAGYRQQRQGDFQAAMDSWRAAGEQGQVLAERLQRGLQIRQQLLSADSRQRRRGLQAWWQWASAAPGPWLWRETQAMIVQSEGQEIIENIERDLVFYGARASSAHPARLLIPGPLDVRVEIRPVHRADSHERLNGWLDVREEGLLRPLPIVNNAPAYALRIQGKALVAGRGINAVYSFGPGLHEVTVSAGDIPVLIRVFARRPYLPLTVLPAISAETMAAAIDGRLQQRIHPARPLDVAALQRQLSALTRQEESMQQRNERLEAERLAAGKIDQALAVPAGERDIDIIRRMRMLLWIKEHHPERAQQVLTLGEALFAKHPMVPGLSTLHARLTADSVWAAQKMLENSAGMQVVTRQGWQPESIRQRVRKALLPPLAADEQVIPGFRRFRIVLNNVQPTRIYLALTAHGVPFSDPLPMQVVYQLDAEEEHLLQLSPARPQRTLALDVPQGRHAIMVGIRNPVADQFLRMRVFEKRSGRRRPIVMTYEQTYYVATHDEPVVLNVRGPMWMRIERREHERSHVSYRQIAAGWHKLVYRPRASQEEVAYRFSGRVMARGALTHSPPSRPTAEAVVLHPVPEAMVRVADTKPAETVQLEDGFEPGEQEDGTWSAGLSYQRRLNASQDRLQFAPVAKFTQLDIWHRFYDEPENRYFRTHLLGRFREHGDTVVGLTERAYFNAPEWPATLRIDGSLYAEHFSGQTPAGVSGTEWSAYLKGTLSRKEYISPKWYHIPSLSGFGRHVSMNGISRPLANGTTLIIPPTGLIGRIDTDVYTPYKQVHRFGIGLSETLAYRPWLDTLLRASVGWQGNEKLLQSDHLTMLLRWDQRLGDAQLNLGYQFTHYYADDYRLHAANTKSIHAELLWDIWQDDQTRWELDAVFRHYLSRPQENVGLIGLTVHFGEGRMYRDFQPGELDIPEFLPLRQRRIPQTVNNTVSEVTP